MKSNNWCLFLLLAIGLYLAGCGGTTSSVNSSMGGVPLTINTGDATNPAIVKFELTVNMITLTGSGGTANTGNLLTKPAEVEFSHQAGTFETLTVTNVPPGTYSGATVTVSNPEVVVLTGSPPAPAKVPATLTSGTVTVSFASPITFGPNSNSVLNLDLDLAASVTLNGNPITSATVTPAFTATASTVAVNVNDDEDEIDDLHGSVKAINAPNFTITTQSGDVTFVTNSSTRFKDGLTQLSDLKVGAIVEVDADMQANGTLLATKVELEGEREGDEVEGIISDVTSSGTPPVATKITIIHQVDSDGSSSIAPLTVDVTINNNTRFSVRTDKLTLTTVPAFDAAHIGKGQRVEADASSVSSPPIVADRLKLREQAIIGTIAATPAPTATGFTVTLAPGSALATLSGQTSIPVSIVNGTKIKSGASLAAGATVRVRGLVFVNGSAYSAIAARIDNNN